jgi:predicted Zn finger-like uncharacterized protein
MYTQCSNCLTIYKLDVESLQQSLGRFRCGHCGSVFDAVPTLTETLPEGHVSELPRAPLLGTPAVLNVPALKPTPQDALFSASQKTTSKGNHASDLEDLFDASFRKEPSLPADWVAFTPSPNLKALEPDVTSIDTAKNQSSAGETLSREQRYRAEAKQLDAERAARRQQKQAIEPGPQTYQPTDEPARKPWLFGATALCAALLVQLGFYQRDFLLAHDDFRPVLDTACKWLGCSLPLRESVSDLSVLEGNVRKHETAVGALIVNATLRNDANFVQAYPVVEVKLLSASNQVIALRRFTPAQYLSSAGAEAEGIPAKAVLPVIFEVLDPGKDATGFEFNFLSARHGVQTQR